MNLQRHHVLYALLAICLIVALLVFLTPGASRVSYRPSLASSSLSQLNTESTTSTPTAAILPLRFEVVTTEAAQERGLGGRSDVPENYAMLFVFPTDQKIGFWMKDMLVPIDMVWLSDTGIVLGVEGSVSPSSYPQIFYPPQPVKYVLETRAGEARRRGWTLGTKIALPLPYSS